MTKNRVGEMTESVTALYISIVTNQLLMTMKWKRVTRDEAKELKFSR